MTPETPLAGELPAPGRGRRRRATRSIGAAVGDALLWVASVGGVVCIVLVVAAYAMNVSLVMFRTGSMEPAIPAGAVAVVQEIPAGAVEVGDVVTVDREGRLPVTHRVTSVGPGPTSASRTLTMRGDANAADDPFPYEVETVRLVRFSVPGIAPAVAALGRPGVLGALTIGAAALVGWAFWPREGNGEGQ